MLSMCSSILLKIVQLKLVDFALLQNIPYKIYQNIFVTYKVYQQHGMSGDCLCIIKRRAQKLNSSKLKKCISRIHLIIEGKMASN